MVKYQIKKRLADLRKESNKIKIPHVVHNKNESLDSKLITINENIKRIEDEIKKQTDRFEYIRNEMLLGIVSHNGITAKSVSDQLTNILIDLKKEREIILNKLDIYSIQIATQNTPGSIISSDCKQCVNGCDPKDIVTDVNGCVDVCMKCHKTYNKMDSTDVSYEDYHPGDTISRVGGYKPPNHFDEIVAQFQGKRRTCAPIEIVNTVKGMCDRYHVRKHQITPKRVRMFLKILQQELANKRRYNKRDMKGKPYKKYTDYYKHCAEISYRLSGIPPPWMTPMQEDRVAAIFLRVIRDYKTSPRFLRMKRKNKHRKTREDPNNMNCLYSFYKICQLLGYDCFLPYISLPKSINNIDDNDENGWRHICFKNNFSYTPTR
jgi:hypothetical protein